MTYDMIFAGGGLACVLTALAVLEAEPGRRILVVEREATLGGQHTWSFHHTDLSEPERAWLAPFVVRSWPGQRVHFPAYQRRLAVPYHSISSARLHAVASARLGSTRVRLGTDIESVGATGLTLRDGTRLEAACVIDGRGPGPSPHLSLAFQSFVGVLFEMAEPHRVDLPVIMDATVDQRDGYRFVYLLPFDERRLLVEDTYYTDSDRLEDALVRARIDEYVAARGWRVRRTLEAERGVLPLLLAGDVEAFWDQDAGGAAPIGLRAALFHPVTGYSLPIAVRVARLVASLPGSDTSTVREALRRYAVELWRAHGYYRMLNRLLFVGADGSERRAVFERFYRLPQGLVQRFYAGRSNWADKARILLGKPPIRLGRALGALPASAARRPASW